MSLHAISLGRRAAALAAIVTLLFPPNLPAAPHQPRATVTADDRSEAAIVLAEQVSEIARSPAISRAKKEKRISTAVRVAVVAATAYKKDPAEVLGTALELTRAAARAAPPFAEIITNAVAFAPSVTRIDGAANQVRTTAFAAAQGPRHAGKSRVATAARPKRVPAEETMDTTDSIERVAPLPSRRRKSIPPPDAMDQAAADSEPSSPHGPAVSQPKIVLDRNSAASFTADLSARHDDNVYLTHTDKVADTIVALTPGVEFRFGQNSLAHGALSYRNAFTRYLDKTSPNVSLGNGSAQFGYDSGSVAIAADGYFQQLNQNNSDVATIGQKAIYRRDVLGLNASVETHVTPKTSVRTGANFLKSDYKSAGLIGSQETSVPVRIYYETTPKVSLSTGASYRRVKPQNDGESAKDWSYDVGARGNFTAKLNGEFSLNYRTRAVGANPRENLWGFNGSLNYELTPKTSSSLVFSRDFNTGALGESLKNSNYTFRVTTELTPQWEISGTVGYSRIEYGPAVFSRSNLPPALIDRNDSFWEGGIQASYLFRSWLTASADYSFRKNNSTISGAEFSNSILSLILGWRY